MIKNLIPLFAVLLLFSCCKSNEKAYQIAYEKIKEKETEREQLEVAEMMSDGVDTILVRTTNKIIAKINESVSVVEGDANSLSKYNIVIKSLINQTNARSLYGRMVEEGHKAVLVKNVKNEYRVVVASSLYEPDANNIANAFKETWPDTWILVRY